MALYGIDRLIAAKKEDLQNLTGPMTDARIRLREEVAEQIKALKEMKIMGEYYGLDLSRPAYTAQEAVQWVYMAYLAAVKEQDGAAMSLGNVSSFLDIYMEYELSQGTITESFAQELIDQFVYIKKTLEWADIFPFLYFHAFFKGLKQSAVIKHLVIDEMQDYTPVQYAVVNKLFDCPKTILGDFGQSANPNLSHSLEDIAGLYDGAELVKLNKSYRSSYEIISFAKQVGGVRELETVERHGETPLVIPCRNEAGQLQRIKECIDRFNKGQNNTLGIVVRTNREAEALYGALAKEYGVQLISEKSGKFEAGVSVVSVRMSKGLEFDEVAIPSADFKNYHGEHGRNLLYIACTRAMHRLTVLYHGQGSVFLNEAARPPEIK